MQENRRWKAPWRRDAGEPAPEDRLAALVAASERPACTIDERGVILAANQRLEELVGFDPGQLSGRPLSVLSDSRDANLRWDVVEALFKEGRDRHEVKGRCVSHRSGDSLWCRWDFSLVRGGRGRRPRAMATVEDLTASVHADSHVRILQYLITAAGRANDAAELLHAAVQVICHFTGCGLGLVWLPEGDELVCSPIGYLHGYGLDPLRRETIGSRLGPGEGLAGAAWITTEEALVERAGDTASPERSWSLERAGAFEAIGVPIRTPSGVAAVLELFVTSDRGVSDRITLIGKVAAELGELLDRRRLNDALRVSEERFRSVADAAVDAIVSADSQGRVLSWNKGAEAMFGWSRDEVIGRPLTVIIPERFHQAHTAGIARVASTGESTLAGTVIELAAVRRDGTEFPVELSIGMWESAEGRGFSGVIRDITERTEVARALRSSEERFRSVADAAVDAIVSADSQGRVLSWNKGAEAMFGWSRDEVIGRPLTVIIPERFHQAHTAGIARVASTGESTLAGTVIELAAVRRDGTEFPVELSIGMWESAEGRGFSGVIRDITERKVAEEAVAAAAREVERTNAELETLIYTASHDLKSPMISVLGYLDYLKLDYGAQLGADGGRYLERMTDCTLYMQRLIADLMELSRVGRRTTDSVDVDLGELVRRIFDEVAATHPGATFHAQGLPVVRADPFAFRQLLTNLVENAVQHGKRDDLVVVVTSRSLPDGSVELSVKDNGVGIPPQYRELVFGIFERLEGASSSERSGTGMGLAICRKITEQLGGRITIEGTTGTDVRVVLPPEVVRTPRPAAAESNGVLDVRAGHQADDNREVRA